MFGSKTPFGGGGFGSTSSAFGTQQTTPFGAASSGGLFGNKTPAAGTFGTPSFGTPSSGGLFGGGTSTGTSLFGSKTTQASTGFGGFGTTNTSGGLFGNTSTGGSSFFQTPQTSNAFGTKTSGFGGFGTTNAFGATSGSTFGSTTTGATSLFGGGGTSVFGATQQATAGTTVKFAPVVSQEQTQKSGISMTVKTQNQCITVMEAYKSKSLEELRCEDYAAGRKGSSTSAFGGTSTGAGLFGSSTANTGTSLFGSTAASKPSGFGGFGTTASNTGGLFGQTSSTGGLFGAKTTASSLFGTTTTTTASGFGGFGTSTGGLFANTNSGTSLFGSTTAQPASGGLFGGTTSAFGTNTSTGGFGFAQPTAQSTSLFGSIAAKPAFGGFGASSGTGFGTSNTLTFGNTASSGSSLFGNTAASKPGFSFGGGTTGFGTATSGFGGFGTTSSSGGLFGGTTSGGLFGNKTTGGFGTTGFGGAATGGTSLFGNTGLGSTSTGFGSLGGTGNTLGGATLGALSNIDQGMLTAFQQQQMIQKQLKAIANTPFGDSVLFRNLSDKSKDNSTTVQPAFNKPADTLAFNSQYKVLSRPAARIKPRPVSSPSLGKSRLFEGLEDEGDFSPHPLKSRRSIKKLIIKHDDYQSMGSPSEENRLKLRQPIDNDCLIASSPDVIKTKVPINNNFNSPISNSRAFDSTMSELNTSVNTPVNRKVQNYVLTPETTLKDEEGQREASPDITYNDDELPACKLILRRGEYYCRPSISTLDQQVVDGQCLVRDFTVGREGYGEVKFLGVTNVYELNLDTIVFFRRREVEVYPDNYEEKPSVGIELNKPAEITLLKVWPNDKSSHTPVKSPIRLKASGFIEKIEEKTLAMDAIFIDYRPKEGAWVFKVNHFTRYGIQEQYISEDSASRLKQQKMASVMETDIDFNADGIGEETKKQIKAKIEEKILEKLEEEAEKRLELVEKNDSVDESIPMEDEEEYTKNMTNTDMQDEEEYVPLSQQIGQVNGMEAFDLQGMKTFVLYGDEEEEVHTPKTLNKSKQMFSNKSIFSSTYIESSKKGCAFPKLDMSVNDMTLSQQNQLNSTLFKNIGANESANKIMKKSHLFKPGLLQTKNDNENTDSVNISRPEISYKQPENIYIKSKTFEMVPYEQSLLFGRHANLCDGSLMHGREFHVSWNNQFTFVHSGTKLGTCSKETTANSNIFHTNFISPTASMGLSNVIINIERFQVNNNKAAIQYIEECLTLALGKSEFKTLDASVLPLAVLTCGVQVLSDFSKHSKDFMNASAGAQNSSYFKCHSEVWDLVNALWAKQEDASQSLYEIHTARRESFSQWLSATLASDVQQEIAQSKLEDDGHLSVIFSLLCGKQIRKACQVARDNKEIRLAFLIAQICGDSHLKHYITEQLRQWEERNIDEYVHPIRLKIYVLLSGLMVWRSTSHHVNLCEALHWKKALALHLWFHNPPTSSIFDAFTDYQNSFKGTDSFESYSSYPSPSYIENLTSNTNIKDICYHLLALYCKRPHALDKLLTPKTYTNNPLDMHLSWHLQQVLHNLGYTHLKEEKYVLLQHSYAAQLESMGLWHWAVFILMHLNDPQRREYYVKDLLTRYCRCSTDETDPMQLSEQELTIVEKYHVPIEWLHEAKALHARYIGQHFEEALHLIRAHHWNEAHVVILTHIAADCIIEEDHEVLKSLLLDLHLPERCCTVKNWKIGGQLFLDYILINEKLEDIKTDDSQMTNYHLEDMEADIASLINRITIMKVLTSRERLCQSEMARTCSNMLKVLFSCMKSGDELAEDGTGWCSIKVAPYVADLPLPPDYYLKELRQVLANYVQEIDERR